MQVQSVVPVQEYEFGSRHTRPLQQLLSITQGCPPPAQALAWQVPLVAPAGTEHEYPEQQSAVVVQTAPCGWQAPGARQVPPMQR